MARSRNRNMVDVATSFRTRLRDRYVFHNEQLGFPHCGDSTVASLFRVVLATRRRPRCLTNVAADKHFSDAASPQW